MIALFSACLTLLSCGTNEPLLGICTRGDTICSEHTEFTLVCRVDGSGWDLEACAVGTLCSQGSCQDISDLPAICETGQTRCREGQNTVERCNRFGTEWDEFLICQEGSTCQEGLCLADSCEAGETECGPTTLYECDESGEWASSSCPDEQPCILGRCLACLANEDCNDGKSCMEGTCQYGELLISTTELPGGVAGTPYETRLSGSGGAAPYAWSIGEGALPTGLELSGDGIVHGTPERAETTEFSVTLVDSRGESITRDLSLQVFPVGPVQLTTKKIKGAKEGRAYSFQFAAANGASPYGWQLLEGSLPQGLTLDFTGKISGKPEEIGSFPLKIRVVDASTPPSFDAGEFVLEVQVAPLEIFGATEFDLFLFKIIVLPPLIPYLPYSANMQARGGVKPYTWTQAPPPAGLSWIIPEWGLPGGLKMGPGGKISGLVTDVSDANTVTIPGGPNISGYFFMGKVTDSRSPAKSATAIFCLPTVAF